jgi:hypothetical protein
MTCLTVPHGIGNAISPERKLRRAFAYPIDSAPITTGYRVAAPIWIADAHRGDGKRFVVRADEKLTAFVELESAIRARPS